MNYLQADKMHCFEIFAFTMYCELETRVSGHSRSSEMMPKTVIYIWLAAGLYE